MVHAINAKNIILLTLILFPAVSVFSAESIKTQNNNQFIYQIIIILLSVFFIFSLVKNFRKNKQLALKEKELKKQKELIESLSENLKSEGMKQASQNSIINTKKIFDEKNRLFLYSLATSDEKKIEETLVSFMPDVEKLILQTFEKGERFKIKELNIDLNKKKISSLEKAVLFEDFDETGKKIFFFPVRGGQQNIGAVIILLKKEADTSDLTISTMNTMASLLSTILIRKKYEKYTQDFQQNVIIALVNILELHDVNEKGHSERVAKTAVAIGERMKLSQAEIIQIYWTAMIHDIGKIFLPYALRSKRARMTVKEYEMFQQHSVWGENIIVTNDELEEISTFVRHHHERWDGRGYPDHLKGPEIPLISRIIAVADSYDNIKNRAIDSFIIDDTKEVLEHIRTNSGKAFDPEIVEIFLTMQQEEL